MGQWRRDLAVRWLVVMVAVLLPAGVLAAVQSRPGPGVPSDLRLGAAGTASALAASTTTTTTAVPPTPAPPTTAATVPARTTPPPTPPTRPSTPPQPSPTSTTTAGEAPAPTTSTTTSPAARSWSAGHDGLSVTLRVEPASPGQPVSFKLDMTSAEACCVVFLAFGDGGNYNLNCGGLCPGGCPVVADAHTASTSHVYPAAGSYTVTVQVLTGDFCNPKPGPPGSPPIPPPAVNVGITACVTVGPPAIWPGC